MAELISSNLGLETLLFCDGASPEIPPCDRIYEFLIGSWDLELSDYLPDHTVRRATGEVHAGWVLEGRAVQDLWISPSPRARKGEPILPGNRFGTTLRVYDFKNKLWNVTWINPVTGAFSQLVGRLERGRVVQSGLDDHGNLIRWTFSEISSECANWSGEISFDQGVTWELQASFRLSRK